MNITFAQKWQATSAAALMFTTVATVAPAQDLDLDALALQLRGNPKPQAEVQLPVERQIPGSKTPGSAFLGQSYEDGSNVAYPAAPPEIVPRLPSDYPALVEFANAHINTTSDYAAESAVRTCTLLLGLGLTLTAEDSQFCTAHKGGS